MGDQLGNLIGGFGDALTPMNLMWVFVGCLLGTAVGVLPGLGSSMAVALLLPITFTLDPIAAFIMFAGIYYGGLFGDSTTAILMNTPGNSTAIASTFEGHRMAKRGRAPQALATAAIGAFVGGILATILVVFFAPVLADLATVFGPAEYFALAIVAFVATAAVVADSAVKGLAALAIGLSLAMVGVDSISGASRYTFGVPSLLDGIDIVVITVGLLAVGEVLHVASRIHKDATVTAMTISGRPYLDRREFREALPAWLRGSAFGLPFGAIPAGGAEIPTFLAFGLERRLDRRRKHPQFGRGAIRGLAAPESAANATAGSAMGSLLALGLPTSATAAIMLAAFQQYGMQPGPLLFTRNADLVWALLASLFVGMVVLLIINLPFAPIWAKLLLIPKPYLYAGITVFAVLGVYAASSSLVDLILLVLIGLIGFMLRRYGLPLAPVLIAVILGPLAETSLRRTLAVSEGDPGALLDSALALSLYGLLALGILVVAVNKVRNRAKVDI
nr:tripartite tricarboxylate transporter permease [Nakamurella leprariae]